MSHAVARLRDARIARSVKPFLARGSRSVRCPACRLAESHCLCAWKPRVAAQSAMCLLMHDVEALKPSNTGWLIADVVADTSAFGWSRVDVDAALPALLNDPHMVLDGFVGPGHVSMVIGIHPYDFIARDYAKPIVVAGFEPLDLLQSVLMVLTQILEGRAEVENQYARVVPEYGNPVSLAAIADVFERRPSFEWRGLGEIDLSGLRIRAKYRAFDAEEKFGIGYAAGPRAVAEPEGCACGQVMTGRIKPLQCPQFGRGCTPDTALGALMVSSEGACAAYWQYGGARLSAALS